MIEFWYLLLGLLFATYFALAGLDYGVGLLLPAIRDEDERRTALNALGPMFLGNEVWIVGAVGVLIAAFPRVEGELFTATYPIMIAILLALVAVNAGVQLRSRGRRRRGFDLLIAVASLTLAVGWGMLLGAVVSGLPLTADGHVDGFGTLLRPYPIAMGLTSVGLVVLHGSAFLAWRLPDGALRDRMHRLGSRCAVPVATAVALLLLLGYVQRAVTVRNPVTATLLGVAVLAAVLGAGLALRAGRPGAALLAGIVATALPVVAVGLANYPAVLISSVDPNGTVTVDSGAAGADALRLLTVAAAPLVPVLFAVQAACWWIFRRRSDRGAPQTLYW